jgi:hypothetical protein
METFEIRPALTIGLWQVWDFETVFLSAYRKVYFCNIFIFNQSARICYGRCYAVVGFLLLRISLRLKLS